MKKYVLLFFVCCILFSSNVSAIIDYVSSPTPSDDSTEIDYSVNVSTCVDISIPGQGCTADIYFFENSSGSWIEYGQSWYDRDWNYRKSFTIDSGFVDNSLSGFPFLVNLVEDSDLVTYAQSDFDDIVFTDSLGNVLPFEFDVFNASTGNLTAWVNISSISSSVDTVFYMYYGNPGCGSQEDIMGTWDSNYVGVWHMNKDNATHTWDSTSNDNDGELKNGVTENNSGIIGNSFDFDGVDDYINVSNHTSLNFGSNTDYTLDAWVDIVDDNRWMGVVNKRAQDGATYLGYRFLISITDNNIRYSINDNNYCGIWSDWKSDSMKYYVYTADRDGDLNFYDDGTNIDNVACPNENVNNTFPLKIGWIGEVAGTGFKGTIDEVRISNIARNSSWVNLTYDTCNQTSGLLTVGKQEMDDGTVSGTYCSNFSIECGTSYYWRVATQFNCSGSLWWENHTYSFTTVDCYVSHISPVNGSTTDCPCCMSLCAKFTNLTGDSVKFAFQSNYSGSWQNLEDTRTAPANNTYCLCVPEFVWYNYTYYWRIVYNAGNGSEYSDVYHFTTESNIDNCPCGLSSSGGDMVDYFDYGLFGLIGIIGLIGIFFINNYRRKK